MNEIKQQIYTKLDAAKARAESLIASLGDPISLDEYRSLVRTEGGRELWSEALQAALDEHEIVVIPARSEPYYIDRQILIGSNRRIEASGATIRQTPECTLLMLRNRSSANGTHAPIGVTEKDSNISISGGRWEESRTKRAGYGSSGKYDEARSFYGVSTLFFFNNMENLTLTNVTIAHTGGFAVQIGDIKGAFFEHIRFDSCYADGLHINGNSENLICRDVQGEVGDDLVALNAYDWQDSSVNFGPIRTVLCEELELSGSSRYKALRIEPGCYYYDDGSEVDCSLSDAIFRNIRGIRTFKLYYQTPRYKLGSAPERGSVGSADNLFFEDIAVDLCAPIDEFDDYLNSDPIRGSFAAFELGANIGYMSLDGIELTLYKKKYPFSYLLCCGPKSIISDGYEIFDPYLSSRIERLDLASISVNGKRVDNIDGLLREIEFDDIDGDGHSTAAGRIGEVCLDGTPVKIK